MNFSTHFLVWPVVLVFHGCSDSARPVQAEVPFIPNPILALLHATHGLWYCEENVFAKISEFSDAQFRENINHYMQVATVAGDPASLRANVVLGETNAPEMYQFLDVMYKGPVFNGDGASFEHEATIVRIALTISSRDARAAVRDFHKLNDERPNGAWTMGTEFRFSLDKPPHVLLPNDQVPGGSVIDVEASFGEFLRKYIKEDFRIIGMRIARFRSEARYQNFIPGFPQYRERMMARDFQFYVAKPIT